MRGALDPPAGAVAVHGIIPAYAGSTRQGGRGSTRTWDHPRVCGEHPTIGSSSCHPKTDHPRVCGEHAAHRVRVGGAPGSSPRMRGAPWAFLRHPVGWGIIPAYAGSTALVYIGFFTFGDHPRVCGEHGRPVHAAAGSAGIIPAYAGSTVEPLSFENENGDHPRVCGEHAAADGAEAFGEGSSPRMRGARGPGYRDRAGHGIIPAYAGSTKESTHGSRPPPDHPRVCGEHDSELRSFRRRLGSSPRMRGAPADHVGPLAVGGIIPAYAGSTPAASARSTAHGDHPRVCGEHGVDVVDGEAVLGSSRVCGEHRSCSCCLLGVVGSSPRMRGALATGVHDPDRRGIIPAYAGSTRSTSLSTPRPGDHPRVCGEHAVGPVVRAYDPGSSPRMRGARQRDV